MSTVDVKPTNRKPGAQAGGGQRAVQARARLVHARDGAPSRARNRLRRRQAAADRRRPTAPRRACPSRRASPIRARRRSCAGSPIPWRCGSPATTMRSIARHAPQNPAARALFDAVEQARVEAIGSRRMEGVASNLTAMLDDRYHRSPVRRGARPRRGAARGRGGDDGARAPDRPEAADAARSASSTSGAPMSRARPARELDKLDGAMLDQRAFAKAVHRLLASLDMASDSRGRRRRERGESEDENAPPDNADDAEGEGEEQECQDSMEMETLGGFRRRTRGRRDGGGRRAVGRIPRGGRRRRIRGGRREPPCRHRGAGQARARLQGLHDEVRRDRQRRGSLRPRGAAAAARLSRQAVAESLQRRRAARQPPAAPADGAAEPLLGVRPRRGHARYRAAAAHRSSIRSSRCRSSAKRTWIFAIPS